MGDLIYTFTSLACRHSNGRTCTAGMRLLAETLHPFGVPITWIVSAESAAIAAKEINRWHETHGDDVALGPPVLAGSRDEKERALKECRDRVREALPWAELTILGEGHTDPDVVAVAEKAGFEGIWGFCWEQIEVDQITDRGCPWGLYYCDPNERLRPAPGTGVVGCEWTAHDLLKTLHSAAPWLYSLDPNDVARGGLCSWKDIDYWKTIADQYERNTRYNEHVFLQQHQEAHEMERGEWLCYTEEDIREAAVMLAAFVKYLQGKARFMTLADAVGLYRGRYSETAPSYMLWEDVPTRRYNLNYAWSTPHGPWPKTFLYCDRGAQMAFIDGKVEPVLLRNYARPWKSGEYFAEPVIPRTRLVRDTRFTWSRELEIGVDSPADMPYGLALWGDYSLYQIAEAPGLLEGKILSRELMFLRYDLRAGQNTLRIALQGK